MQVTCKCGCDRTIWLQQNPKSIHRYRVECANCRLFLKWGNARQLRECRECGDQVTVEEYVPPSTLQSLMD